MRIHVTGRTLPRVAIPIALAALAAAIFGRTTTFGFVNLDDPEYVSENPNVLGGLSAASLRWAFTASHGSNWHPLTTLSHLADLSLFGLSPGWMHAENAVLHALAGVLLYTLLRRTTGAVWKSAFVAALFVAHPLHVESVAWISERKDVLSTVLLLAAMHAWIAYTARPGLGRYALVAGLFVLGLAAKPMLVTFPVLALLLDLWPLGRFSAMATASGTRAQPAWRLVTEKLPFVALAVLDGVATLWAQGNSWAGSAYSKFPLGVRVANGIVGAITYLGRTAWPAGLGSFYPHPASVGRSLGPFAILGAAALLVALSVLAWRERTRRPWILWGWGFYLVALAPVSGLVQVGGQATADRYTYVPLIGVFVVIAWGGEELLGLLRLNPRAMAGVAIAAVLALAAVAYLQVGTWRDSTALNQRAIEVDPLAWRAWHGLCGASLAAGRLEDALRECAEAVRIRPGFAEAWNSLGVATVRLGRDDRAALPFFRQALALRPDSVETLFNLGTALARLGDPAQARAYFREATRIRPEFAPAWLNDGLASIEVGDRAEALAAWERLRALDPARAELLQQQIPPNMR